MSEFINPVCGIFKATIRSNPVCRAGHTAPKAPTPTRFSSWNLGSGRIMAAVLVCRASRNRKELSEPGRKTSSEPSS
jgi:hypothetical protein